MNVPVKGTPYLGPCPGCGAERDPGWVRGWRGWKCGSFNAAHDWMPVEFKQSLACGVAVWRRRAEIAEARLEGLTSKSPTPITKPLTRRDMDEDGWVTGIVSVGLNDAVDNDLEGFLDLLSEALVGDSLLMDVTYKVVGLGAGEDELLVEVRGDASLSFKSDCLYVCDNCGFTAEPEELPDAKDLWQRLTPGGIYTNKECPECGALCFPGKLEQAVKS